MSQILKAKNRILNRSKTISNNQQNQEQYTYQLPFTPNSHINQFNEQALDIEPVTTNTNKKFNISSISMKFTKNQDQDEPYSQGKQFFNIKPLNIQRDFNQQQRQSRKQYQQTKSQYNQGRNQQSQRLPSPQFSRTERINPIRHFQPYNFSTLSESNSQSSLRKLTRDKSRRTSMQSRVQQQSQQQNQKKLERKNTVERAQSIANESPINKIKKTVHFEPLNLLIVRLQQRRSQSPYKPRQCIKQYTQNLIIEAQETHKPFIDSDFPPKQTIVFPKKSLYQIQKDLSFERIQKCYQNLDIQAVLLKTCQPTLINPGKFTNPFLYSAVRILAEYPQKVFLLFQNQKVNSQGIYYVKLCKDGTWRHVIVDDYVPVKTDSSNRRNNQFLGLNYTDSNGVSQIWPSLVQKALSKIYGTYYDLSMSRRDGICPLLRALTGFPVSKYDLIKDVRSYLVLIDSALKKQHIVVVEQILPEFEHLTELKGISSQQSYQILQIKKNCFVLRNLADFDLVTRLTFDQVMMFSSLLIFRKQQDYIYISQKLRHKKGYYSSLKVKVQANTQCYWDVWQNNPAYYKNHMQNQISFEVSPYKLLLQPISIDSGLNQFDSIPQPETIVQSGKQISMKKGEYLISLHVCQSLQQMDFTLSYYGQKDVQIQRVKNYVQKWSEKCCSK